MKLNLLTCAFLFSWFLFPIPPGNAQQVCIPTSMNGTVIDFVCPQTCTDINFRIPHIKTSTEYRVITTIPYAPYPFVTPGGNEPVEIYVDDKFSHLNNLPFPVCFYGNVYNQFVIGSNGVVSFDVTQADCNNDFRLDFGPALPGVPQQIPHVGTGTCNQTNDRKYPALSIMGPYHDLNPNVTATTPDRKVEWRVEGTAPCRKLIVSFYQIALYGDINSVNTSQIVVHESTGIIDVFIEQKRLDGSGGAPWNGDFAILGLQKDNSTAMAPSGRNCTVWQENNRAYRFVPSGPGSRFVSSELLTVGGTLVATADTSTVVQGQLDIRFTNICPPTGSNQYVIKTVFSSCSTPGEQLINLDTITLNLTNSLNAAATTTNTDCGPPTGTITVAIPPGYGNPPYNYSLDGGAPVTAGSPYTFTNVTMGPHTVSIADATNTCTSNLNVTVIRNNGLLADMSATPASCSNVYNGTITVNAQNGTAPFSYQLDGFLPVTGPNPFTFTNVNGGNHNIIVYDATGCQSNVLTIDVAVNAGVSGNAISTAATCPTVSNGSITVTAVAGTPPYTFSLDGGAPQSGSSPYTFNGVSPGPHTVVITDFVGCSRFVNITVDAGPALVANHIAAATSCFGAVNGSVTITPNNGSGPYSYSLDGLPAVPGSVPYTFTNVAAGLHNYQVFDAAGCASIIYPVMVDPGPQLVTTANRTHVLCNGDATGTITVNPPPLAIPPFDYSLDGSNWQSSAFFSALTAGNYTVYFRSVNGCQGTLPVTINQPAPLSTSSFIVPVSCNGENDGVITVATSGGTSPYQYSINGGINWQPSNTFTVPAGNYTVTIRDINNCTSTRNVTMTQPAVLTAFSANTNATCDGGDNGRITVNATGGNANYRYSLDGFTFQSLNYFDVAPGTYTVTVKDDKGCSAVFTTIVGLTFNLSLPPQADLDMCEGKSIQLQTVSNATQYTWSPASGLSNVNIANPVASPAITSEYILTAVLGRCTAYDTVIVNVRTAPIPNAGPDGDICYGQSYTLQGTGGTQYTWTPQIYLNTNTGANPVSTPTKTTVYTLSVADAIGCQSIVTDEVKVVVKRVMKVNTFPYDTIAHPGDQVQLLATSPGISYTWSPPVRLSSTTIPNPVVTVGDIGENMQYEVVAVDEEGCKAEGYVRIRVYKGPEIYVPTGFTPNGDGLNDVFVPVPVGISSYNYFRVYNRWGQLVFSTNRMNAGWDGKLGGREQSSGTYVWMVEGITEDKRVITKKGTILLIR